MLLCIFSIINYSTTSNINSSDTLRNIMTLNEGPHHIHTTTATIGGSRVIANEYNYVFISDGTPSISNNQRSMDLDAEMNSININTCLTYTYYYSYPWT